MTEHGQQYDPTSTRMCRACGHAAAHNGDETSMGTFVDLCAECGCTESARLIADLRHEIETLRTQFSALSQSLSDAHRELAESHANAILETQLAEAEAKLAGMTEEWAVVTKCGVAYFDDDEEEARRSCDSSLRQPDEARLERRLVGPWTEVNSSKISNSCEEVPDGE